MRWSERIKKSLRALPKGQWRCIWCDRTTPEVTFEAREHVMPESLGGASDFKLPRGAVCDQCNKHGVLKQIDEELNIFYVSLKPGIEPLQELRSRHSWLRVVGELPDAE